MDFFDRVVEVMRQSYPLYEGHSAMVTWALVTSAANWVRMEMEDGFNPSLYFRFPKEKSWGIGHGLSGTKPIREEFRHGFLLPNAVQEIHKRLTKEEQEIFDKVPVW